MKSSLDLSLPEAPRRRSRPGILAVLTFLAAAGCLALLILDPKGAPGAGTPAATSAAERLRSLAADLEKRTLHHQAAEVWDEYLAAADRVGPYLTLLRGLSFERDNVKWCARCLTVLERRGARLGTPT